MSEQDPSSEENGASRAASSPEKPNQDSQDNQQSQIESTSSDAAKEARVSSPDSVKSKSTMKPAATKAENAVTREKLLNAANLATSMVAKATAKENTFNIPQTIEVFKPKRQGHVEH